LDRIWRSTIRPRLVDADHSVPNLDLLWQFQEAGLQNVQINGHLALVSPGDARIPIDEAATYALTRHRKELDRLLKLRQERADEMVAAGFSAAELDELIALKQARYDYLLGDPERVREVMEVFTESLLIIRGAKTIRRTTAP